MKKACGVDGLVLGERRSSIFGTDAYILEQFK